MELTQDKAGEQVPRVVIKPPLLFLGFLAMGSLANLLYPLWSIHPYVQLGFGSVLLLGGLVILVLAMRRFRSEATPVSVRHSSRVLVRDGVYARSRNPIYLGMVLAYTGFALLETNVWLLILMPLLLLCMYLLVIFPEERYLSRRFGRDYLEYCRLVRRWF